MSRKIQSPTKRKVLLLLQAGLALGLTPSPKAHFYIFKQLAKEWEEIDRQYLYRIVRDFNSDRLVDWKENRDGSIRIVLTEEGRRKALEYHIDKIEIQKSQRWDGKWRVVMFDVPEKRRKGRDSLRYKLKELGFHEMQKSVFVYPFHCRDEIDFVAEFFKVGPCICYAEMTKPTKETELKAKFGLK